MIVDGRDDDDVYVDSGICSMARGMGISCKYSLFREAVAIQESRNDSGKNRTEGRVTEIIERSGAEIVGIIESQSSFRCGTA